MCGKEVGILSLLLPKNTNGASRFTSPLNGQIANTSAYVVRYLGVNPGKFGTEIGN
jgi:hypothetical protein